MQNAPAVEQQWKGEVMEEIVVTGAYGYSGKYITRRLLQRGYSVRTLTNSPERENPFGNRVRAYRYHFDRPDLLEEALIGARALINTYWVRFDHDDFTHSLAVQNTQKLFRAARKAGVGRVVHVSITNPSLDSDLPYFQGKAFLEKALQESGLPNSILRPAVLFGGEDILINNIAWVLRRLPVFGVFGDGRYRLQPIHVDDLAALAVEESAASGSRVIDAVGPETFPYRGLVKQLGKIIGKPRPVVSVPPALGYAAARLLGLAMNDVLLTWNEIQGLMAGLLHTESPPAGSTRLTDWAREHADTLGVEYASELARRRNRQQAYKEL